MRPLRKLLLGTLAFAATAAAQMPVAPTPDLPSATARGENWSGYNILDSFETGYRFRSAGGDLARYRSDVNYGNGIRLLGSYLNVHSRDGHGRFFDELVLTTQGLGNDPYESAAFRIQKNRLYRYDLIWRSNTYVNPGLVTGGQNSLHASGTTHTLQDHDLVLLPESSIRFFLGYSRTHQTGPALSSVELFDIRGNEFPLFTDVRRKQYEFRVGNEIGFAGFRFNWLHAWQDFKEDTPYSLTLSGLGVNPTNPTALTSFQRREPYHGASPYWRAALFSDRKLYNVNGRFTYTSGQRAFVLDESAFGTGRFGSQANRQIVTAGRGRRPVATGNLTLSLFPGRHLTVTNQTSIYNVRTEGDSLYRQFDQATLSQTSLYFQYLGIYTIANHTEANYRAAKWLGLHGGYEYSSRRIRSAEQQAAAAFTERTVFSQTNTLHTGAAGVRVNPVRPLTIMVDGEIGRADRPFTPVAEKNYHAVNARVQYKLKSLFFSASTRTNYNNNAASMATYSSHARTASADISWTPAAWIGIDASYSKFHLDTLGALAYFATFQLVDTDKSLYVSNIHSASAGIRLGPLKRVEFFAGYSRVQDTGDGPANPTAGGTVTSVPAFQIAQTLPLTYQSPMGRVSVRLREKLRWNAGYQYYGYNEMFFRTQDYRAHTGYTSLLWSF